MRHGSGRAATDARVRRSPHLVLYWRGETLVVRNYATGRSAAANALICRVLDFCAEWRTLAAIGREVGDERSPLLAKLVAALVARSFLHRSDRPLDPRERAMQTLGAWNPEAGFFHTATREVRFWPQREATRRARAQARLNPMPAVVKRYRGRPRTALPVTEMDGAFAGVARGRRTWRRFSREAVSLGELSWILGLSAGVQQWVRVGGRDIPLKTSPSGGARHPVETYVVARRVSGLRPGVYHYDAGRHGLEYLRRVPTLSRIRAYMPTSDYFAAAPVLVFFTAVLERQLWRYPYSRAYRAALIEVGHVAQTLCLAATALQLAPFSVMGLADAVIEQDLGVDGIMEPVLYAAGFGRRPAGVSWAPRPRGTLPIRPNPALSGRHS